MTIEETIHVKAESALVWASFADLTRWNMWNTIATRAKSESGILEKGKSFSFYLWPYAIPVKVIATVDELSAPERITWSGSRFGLTARHEFIFQKSADDLLVTSCEHFWGLPLVFAGPAFPDRKIRELTWKMLLDLKKYCETDHR